MMIMKRRNLVIVALLFVAVGANAQKEYRQLRTQFKNDEEKNVENPLRTVQSLQKNDKFKDDPELFHYGVEAYLKINDLQNRKAYLKQQCDTAKLFDSILGIYEYAIGCDTLEALEARKRGKDKVKYKYRGQHGELLRRQYTNLYNGGQYYLLKKNFENAYKFFSMFCDIRSNPVFGGGKVSAGDSAKMQRAAYWATVCAFQLGDRARFFKYNDMALRDTTYRQKELEFAARMYKAAGDTAGFVRTLERGMEEFPRLDYFFTNLTDYYNSKKQYDKAMALADRVLKIDPRSLMAQYGRSLVLLKMRKYDECVALSKSIIQSDSTYTGAYYNAGAAYLAKATELEAKITSNMTIAQIRNIKREEDKLMRNSLIYLEQYRALAPEAIEWWGRPLYNIYLSLNMGEKFDEIDKLITKAENDKKAAEQAAAAEKKK